MSDTTNLSEAKRALLEKYLQGKVLQSLTPALHTGKEVVGERERVVPVQTKGTRLPFFFLHGQYEGNAFFCYPLARDLGADQPFYVLEPYNFDGLSSMLTFEEIAAAHLKSLRAAQPEGPYLLGGWCNGGLLAYEMAQQLLAEEQKVDLLVLMDCVPLTYQANLRLLHHMISGLGMLIRLDEGKQLDWFLSLRHLYRYGFLSLRHLYRYVRHTYRYMRYRQFRKLDPSERWLYFGAKKFNESLPEKPEEIVAVPKPGDPELAFPGLDRKTLRQDYPGVYEWIALDYKPRSLYPGKVTFFWSEGEIYRYGWLKMEATSEVEIHLIPGDHVTCRTNYLHDLTEHLKDCLGRAQPAASS